jgi:hypothetical protein
MPRPLEGMLAVSVEQAVAVQAVFEDERPAGGAPALSEHATTVRMGFVP